MLSITSAKLQSSLVLELAAQLPLQPIWQVAVRTSCSVETLNSWLTSNFNDAGFHLLITQLNMKRHGQKKLLNRKLQLPKIMRQLLPLAASMFLAPNAMNLVVLITSYADVLDVKVIQVNLASIFHCKMS